MSNTLFFTTIILYMGKVFALALPEIIFILSITFHCTYSRLFEILNYVFRISRLNFEELLRFNTQFEYPDPWSFLKSLCIVIIRKRCSAIFIPIILRISLITLIYMLYDNFSFIKSQISKVDTQTFYTVSHMLSTML